jgi:hypothetical protein
VLAGNGSSQLGTVDFSLALLGMALIRMTQLLFISFVQVAFGLGAESAYNSNGT